MRIIDCIFYKSSGSKAGHLKSPSEQPASTKSTRIEEVFDYSRKERLKNIIRVDQAKRNARRQRKVSQIKARHQHEVNAAKQLLWEMGIGKEPPDGASATTDGSERAELQPRLFEE